MLRDVKNAQLGDLQTANRVLDYAIASRQAQNQAETQTAAASKQRNPQLWPETGLVWPSLTSFYGGRHKVSGCRPMRPGVVLWRAGTPETLW